MIKALEKDELVYDPKRGINQETAIRQTLEEYGERTPEKDYSIESEEVVLELEDIKQELEG